MDGQIQGSKIGLTTNSETKMANAIRIQVPFSDPTWLLIDTPGFGDTEGPMDNIVSAVSIAKVLRARLKTPPACPVANRQCTHSRLSLRRRSRACAPPFESLCSSTRATL